MFLALGIAKGPAIGWLPIILADVILAALLLVLWNRHRSLFGVRFAVWYLVAMAIPCLVTREVVLFFPLSFLLTVPWSLFLPSTLVDMIGNRTLGGMLLMCAELNAVSLAVIAIVRARKRRNRGPQPNKSLDASGGSASLS